MVIKDDQSHPLTSQALVVASTSESIGCEMMPHESLPLRFISLGKTLDITTEAPTTLGFPFGL